LQELIRQWILLIPLATSVAGSAALQTLPSDKFAELMPPMFFVGALIVTGAMLHQRSLLTANLALTDELQAAHERLDTLHHLAIELSTTLHVAQVAETVLNHTLQLVDGECGALWLKTEVFPPQEMESLLALNDFDGRSSTVSGTGDDEEAERPWRLFAAHGFVGFQNEKQRTTLREWHAHLEKPEHGSPSGEAINSAALLSDSGLVWVPVLWKGETQGAIFVQTQSRALSGDSLVLLNDIALLAGPSLQNALLYQSASERAEVDGLTGLYNHRSIQERLQQEVARVVRAHHLNSNMRFAIAVMDITDFKLFNDTYGHAVGDQVLRSVSECLKKTFRVSDTVGRFGGDEFLALLPDTPCRGSEVLCARAVGAIAAQPFIAPDGSPISIRLTCGVATFPEDGTTPTELLKAADERLYAAKRTGELIVDDACARNVAEVLTLKPEWNSIGLLDTLVSTIDSKDHYTRSQCERVWRYSLMIAQQLQFSSEKMQATHFGALVHDVGKIVVPDAILRKPGRLTSDEFRIMQQHTIFGAMIVKDLPQLESILGAVRHHHEHWDGSGYPDKLQGEAIPVIARILAVADSFSAMITPRPYRKALSEKQAFEEIERQKGKQYDPVVVEAFRSALESLAADAAALQRIFVQNNIGHLCRLEVAAENGANGSRGPRNGESRNSESRNSESRSGESRSGESRSGESRASDRAADHENGEHNRAPRLPEPSNN
jgi:diguanylate cyclase (GGDEF)-like protein